MVSTAALFGAAIPLLPFGIAVTQGLFGLGLAILLLLTPFEPKVRSTYAKLLYHPITFALTVMIMVWLATVPWSSAPWESFKVVTRTALYIAGSGLIWSFFYAHQNLQQKALKVLIVLTFVMVVIACASLIFPDDIWKVFQSISGNTKEADLQFKRYSSALLCLMPVLVWGGHRLGGKWNLSAWVTVPGILYVIVAAQSRSSVAGILIMLAAVALVVFWAKGKLPKIILTVFPLTIVAGITWVLVLGQRYKEIQDSFLPELLVDPHRQVIWRFVFEKFLEAPWAGHGINRINFVPGADTVRADIGGKLISSHPHNWILEILSETGIFGFSALAIVLSLLAWRLLIRYKYASDEEALALIALSAAFFGSSLFNFSIWSSWWLLTFFVLFAIVSAGVVHQRENIKTLK